MPILRALTSAGILEVETTLSYDASQIQLGKKGNVQSTARLVPLPHDPFVDFGPGPQYPEGASGMILSGDRGAYDCAHLD